MKTLMLVLGGLLTLWRREALARVIESANDSSPLRGVLAVGGTITTGGVTMEVIAVELRENVGRLVMTVRDPHARPAKSALVAMLKLILGTTLTLLAAACAGVPASPSTVSPSPSEEPPAPLGEGSPTASATGDGFVVELWLDRGRVRVGDRLHALVRVTNAGDAAPMWETNTCQRGPAALNALVADGLRDGQAWDGLAGEFKELALLEAGVESTGQAAVGEFVSAEFVDRDDVLCLAISIMRPFVPGQTEQELLAWDVVPKVGLTIPSGELTLTSTFASDLGEVTAEATVHVEADDVPILTLVDYIDAALSEPSFRQWVEAHPRDGWLNTTITFWPNTEGQMPQFPPYTRAHAGAVDVGLFAVAPGQGYAGMVVLERSTAEVLGTRFE